MVVNCCTLFIFSIFSKKKIMNDTQNTNSLNGMKFELELFWRKKNLVSSSCSMNVSRLVVIEL